MDRKLFLRFIASAVAGTGMVSRPANAQAFPNRPLTMVVPFNAGASTDKIARAVADGMSKALGQPVVVENKPGAASLIGASAVTRAPADGYKMLMASDTALVLNGLLYKKPSYDPEQEFRGIGLLANSPMALVVNASLPFRDLTEFVAWCKANPGKLNYGSTGTGGLFHLVGEMFCARAGVEMVHVPYTGGAPALQALRSGEVQVMFGIVGSMLPHLRAGTLRALALVTKNRLDDLPGVPTMVEMGYAGTETLVRYGLVVAKSTPVEIVAKLNDAMNAAITDPQYRKRFAAEAYLVPPAHTAAEFDAILTEDRLTWGKLIKSRKISLD